MKYGRVLSTAVAVTMMTAATAHAEQSVSPREAKQAINAMEKANSSLSNAVKAAEDKTGGKAFSVEILPMDTVESVYAQSSQAGQYQYKAHTSKQNKNAADKNKSDKHAKSSQDEITDQTSEENKQLAQQDRSIDRQAPHAKVKCLLSGNRVRCAMVNLENNQVVRVRNIGHGSDEYNAYSQNDRYNDSYHRTYSRYDRNPYDNDQYRDAVYNDRNDYDRGYDNRMFDMRDHGRNTNRSSQIDYGYIEQNVWPPNRDDRYYSSRTASVYSSNYDDRNRSSRDYDNQDYDRRSSSISQSRGGTGLVLASDLMNAQVRNHSDQDVGDISDLAIDPSSKCLVYATLTHGGFLGLGQKRFAIPSEELSLSNNGSVYIDASRKELDERKGFDSNNWPKQADSYWSTSSNQHMQDDLNQKQSNPATEIVKASEIIDRDVVDENGQTVGEVEDLVVDPSRGKVAYLLVEVGDGLDEGLVAVPAAAVKHNNDKCVVQAGKSTIESAQKFSSKNQPNWNNMRWNEDAHARFNVSPYWRDSDNRLSSSQQAGG